MKTAMQKLIQFLEHEEGMFLESGDYATSTAYGLAKEEAQRIMLSDEKDQIANAFVNGMMQGTTLQLREQFGIVQTPEQFYNEKYTENEN